LENLPHDHGLCLAAKLSPRSFDAHINSAQAPTQAASPPKRQRLNCHRGANPVTMIRE
jgi:hypothetical protein